MIHETCYTNTFLVAMPGMSDKRFERSVIYLCEHSEQGALGVAINVPLKASYADLLIHLGHLNKNTQGATLDQALLWGGPCVIERGFVLHRATSTWKTQFFTGDNVSLTTSQDILESIGQGTGPAEALIAFGCSRWESGQLERELADNAWLVVPSSEMILFECPLADRWDTAAHTLGIDFKLMTYDFGHA